MIAVLAAASGTPAEPREQEENLWGHPVDRLRYRSSAGSGSRCRNGRTCGIDDAVRSRVGVSGPP